MNETDSKRRVVITGIGVVAPNGHDLDTFWNSIKNGESAGKDLTRFDAGDMPVKIAAEIRNFDPVQYIDAKRAKRLDLSTLYGIVAAVRATKDAGIRFDLLDADRAGVVEAISLGGTETTIAGVHSLKNRNYRSINAFSLINGYTGGGSGEIALQLGIHGHAMTYCAGSASGNEAMGYALNMIRQGDVDVMVAGGTEAPLIPELWAVFSLNRVMTSRNEMPKASMRPFDVDRDGFLLGEGAAFMILEELSFAISRGAKIYAEVAGHGRSCEAYHSVAPHPEGIGVYRAMEKALRNAKLSAPDVDYINAHGTATSLNDAAELKAIQRFFGERAKSIAVSSTKPVTGHLLGAAGSIETAICALAIHHQIMPFTQNLRTPIDNYGVQLLQGASRHYPIETALNLSSGFGGKNACLVLTKYHS
jgi:3-oxoacyl-[acyl-carrier-protein] synthase II